MTGLRGNLKNFPALDAWIAVNPDRTITVRTGKVEIGQGLRSAIAAVAAEELDVEMAQVRVETADTANTPDEGYTSGSGSMQQSATAVRQAAAECRRVLLGLAAELLDVPAEDLSVEAGVVRSRHANRQTDYWELHAGRLFGRQATGGVAPKDPADHRLIGDASPRLDLPAKIFGEPAFIHDLDLPGMVHGRVIRGPVQPSRIVALDPAAIRALPEGVTVHREGDFLGVVAEREIDAIRARGALHAAIRWADRPRLPDEERLHEWLVSQPVIDRGVADGQEAGAPPPETAPTENSVAKVEAWYTKPYLLHGSIGPSCAIADWRENRLTVWTHSQGVFQLRGALAAILRLPLEAIRCVHREGAGCYGHNGADDVALDAALLARAVAGRPVRVQWHREDENLHEPYSTPMAVKASAALGADRRVHRWRFDLWSHNHGMRPGASAGHSVLLAAGEIAAALPRTPRRPAQGVEGGEHRNAWPAYDFGGIGVAKHFVEDSLFRCSSLRGLGAYANVFAIESMIDELAEAAGEDAVALRLRHLRDPRARAVVEAAAGMIGWDASARIAGRGRSVAFARYKNQAAYCAVGIELAVDAATGVIRLLRAAAAVDAGEAIAPDNIVSQVEGGVIQAASWTMKERVRFGPAGSLSADWAGYPIMTFAEAPLSMETRVLDQPGEPFLGVGEASVGPTPAAICSALQRATGVRIRELPLLPEKVKSAIAEARRLEASNRRAKRPGKSGTE